MTEEEGHGDGTPAAAMNTTIHVGFHSLYAQVVPVIKGAGSVRVVGTTRSP